MKHLSLEKTAIAAALAALVSMPSLAQAPNQEALSLSPSTMKSVGEVDERYQSYNVEMLEVTGGSFWKPYKDIAKLKEGQAATEQQNGDVPTGMSPDLYQYRPPLDLTNPRLRALAKALGPAYMRVSGTWANTTFFSDAEKAPEAPPEGYKGLLTRDQWLGAIDFSNAVGAEIVTSMPIGDGIRDENGVWKTDQAKRWLDFTKKHGGTIAAIEFFNEPTLVTMGGAPEGYDAEAYGRDHKIFEEFMRKEYPEVKLLAPGSVGEATADWGVAMGGYGDLKVLHAEDLTKHTPNADAFSYHHYGAVSQRCTPMGFQTTPEDALSEEWLGRTDQTLEYYRQVRDKTMPGKPFWNTETADAACGGNPWAGTFLDTFRYTDQLGRLALQEVDVVIHNTLVASDYGMLDENTFEPKPNYWGALLWSKLMGTTVLDAGVKNGPGMHAYAQCLRDVPGGVAMLVLNTDREKSQSINLPMATERYTLSAANLTDKNVLLNGQPLKLGADDALPEMKGVPVKAGAVTFAPGSITFLAAPEAKNQACM